MRICIAIKGEINSRLWSGTPLAVYKKLSEKQFEVDILDWRYLTPLLDLYFFIFSKLVFIWPDAAADPFVRLFQKYSISTKLSKINKKYDYIFFIPDMCTPSILNDNKLITYTDAVLADLLPYLPNKICKNLYMKFFERNLKFDYENANIIFTQNEWSRQSMISRYNLCQDKIHNVGFGVNLQPYYGFKDYTNELLLIVLRKGTEEYKGLYLLLDAFKILKSKRPNVKLAVVGTPERKKIDGVTFYYNLSREVTIDLFKKCTLYTMPSNSEPNGITYLEALINRSPIVGLNRFAFPEFSGNSKWGFMVQNEDCSELAEVLDRALDNKELLEKMGKLGQDFVLNRYRWDLVVDRMINTMQLNLNK